MADIAKSLRVVLNAQSTAEAIQIDGKSFDYAVAAQTIRMEAEPHGPTIVYLPILVIGSVQIVERNMLPEEEK